MLNAHMTHNNTLLADFKNGINALKDATLKTAEAAEKQNTDITQARHKKGPNNNKFPKFHGKAKESFSDWNEDTLSILALSEWSSIYDTTSNDIIKATTDDTKLLSEHLYSALRQALQGNAGTTMKSNEVLYRNKGI